MSPRPADAVRTDDFAYALPAGRIAQRPAPPGESRLLVLDAEGAGRHRRIAELPALLRPGDLLVVNDTRVLAARLFARRASGGGVEILLVEKTGPSEWLALARPARRLRPGTRLVLENPPGNLDWTPAGGGGEVSAGVEALVDGREGDRFRMVFGEPIEPHLERLGHVPLPPYIRRPDEAADRERYQTIFARHPGAVAAPTAGLHFTPSLVTALRAAEIGIAALTLHVGPGTFRPVTAARVEDHRMEAERYTVPEEAAAAITVARERGGRVIAVGTTVVRALETVARDHRGAIVPAAGVTGLFIVPGFSFQVVDLLLTNFHLPRSTLLMLVSAFGGHERVLAAYEEAVGRGYRFYSYGDAMLASRRSG